MLIEKVCFRVASSNILKPDARHKCIRGMRRLFWKQQITIAYSTTDVVYEPIQNCVNHVWDFTWLVSELVLLYSSINSMKLQCFVVNLIRISFFSSMRLLTPYSVFRQRQRLWKICFAMSNKIQRLILLYVYISIAILVHNQLNHVEVGLIDFSFASRIGCGCSAKTSLHQQRY